jgi:hypothetical protein
VIYETNICKITPINGKIIYLSILLIVTCSERKQVTTDNITLKLNDSSVTHQQQVNVHPQFISFMGIEFVARSDNSIEDSLIDSISTNRLKFRAKYLSCFRVKGNIKARLYQPLKLTQPEEYKEIISIRTGHSLIVNDTLYHFSGRNKIDCNNYPDSNDVDAYVSIYSLFSGSQLAGKIIIIDSVVSILPSTLH